MRTIIKNVQCVFPGEILKTDILLENEKIVSIAPAGTLKVDEVIPAEGLHLIPGVIDDHVHFREPGLTHKEDIASGSIACAKSGVTGFLEMPNTKPPTLSRKLLLDKLLRARRTSAVNYGFYIGASRDNVEELKQADRTPGIKIFIGSSTGSLLVDEQDILERIFGETELPICTHCEDETLIQSNIKSLAGGKDYADHSLIRDQMSAIIATRRAIELALRHHHRLHILHVSTMVEIDLIKEHRRLITTEVCPHHLYFNTSHYAELGARVQMNPSVKSEMDNEALWQALRTGEIQNIASDHAPHTLAEKSRPYPDSPSGIPAVENILPLMLDAVNKGKLTLIQLVNRMCEAPAKIWDIVGKGKIEEGYDADLVLIDMNKEETVLDENQVTKCKWSPWHGVVLNGYPTHTWVRGKLVYKEGKFDYSARGSEIVYDHSRGGYWGES